MRINVTRDAKKSPTADEDKNGNRHVSAASNHGPIDAKVFEKWVEVETDRMNAMAAAPAYSEVNTQPESQGRGVGECRWENRIVQLLGVLKIGCAFPTQQQTRHTATVSRALASFGKKTGVHPTSRGMLDEPDGHSARAAPHLGPRACSPPV